MSYCIQCGKQTDDPDFICEECRQKQTASHTGENQKGVNSPSCGQNYPPNNMVRQQYPPNTMSYGQNYSPYGQYYPPVYPYNGYAPYDNSRKIAVSGNAQPKEFNKCGLIGLIFSIAGLVFFIGSCILFGFTLIFMIIFLHTIVAGADWIAWQSIGILVFVVLSFGCSVTGVSLSGIGVSRLKKYRASGLAIAGLVIGIITLLLLFSVLAAALGI